MSANADGTINITNNGFVIHGGCNDTNAEAKTVFLNSTKGGDDIFKLTKLPSEFCTSELDAD